MLSFFFFFSSGCIDSVGGICSEVSERSRLDRVGSKLSCVMYLQAKPLLWFLSPVIISGVPCFASPLAGRFSWSWAASLVIWLLAWWVSQFSVLSVATTSASGSCLPIAVSSELCCLAPEQAKSKHSTLWLKGHLSRGGNPASPPKSINRGGLLSCGAAHCHGNAPSE